MNGNPYRIVFMGTPEFAVPSLRSLIEHGEEVVAVVSQPDRPKGRGRKLAPTPTKALALSADIPVLQPTKIRTQEFHDTIQSYEPDLIVVTAYGRILPGSLLSLPPLGIINVHGSLLPKYRGAAPIQWALINSEPETGVTIMQMDEGMDTGDILLPAAISVDDDDTTVTMAPKLAKLGGKALVQALDLLRENKLPPHKQDDSQATMAPLLTKEQGQIDWSMSALAISGLIRGLDPWPKAYSSLDGKKYKLFSPQVIDNPSTEKPGTLCLADNDGLVIATGEGQLRIRAIQKEGAKRMKVGDFLRGHPLSSGSIFK